MYISGGGVTINVCIYQGSGVMIYDRGEVSW